MKCKAKKLNGSPCSNSAISGKEYCIFHQSRISGFSKLINSTWFILLTSLCTIVGLVIAIEAFFLGKNETKIEKVSGELSSHQILSIDDNIFPKMRFGNKGPIVEHLRYLLKDSRNLDTSVPMNGSGLWFLKDTHFTVQADKGKLKVSTIIRNKDGAIIAEMIKNEWKINKNNIYDRNYSDNALEIKDNSGDVVLQILLIKDVVQLQGKFYDSDGYGMAFSEPVEYGSDFRVEYFDPHDAPYDKLQTQIIPIFKYPSELHLGEMIK